MGPFIAPHIRIVRELFRKFHLFNEAEDGGFGKLTVFDRTLIFQLPEDLGCGKTRASVLDVTDLLVKSVIDLTAYTAVRATRGKQSVKSGVFVGKMPFLDGSGGIMAELAVRSFDSFG